MRRVQYEAWTFGIDALACPACEGARLKLISFITERDTILRIPSSVRLPTRAPPIEPARQLSFSETRMAWRPSGGACHAPLGLMLRWPHRFDARRSSTTPPLKSACRLAQDQHSHGSGTHWVADPGSILSGRFAGWEHRKELVQKGDVMKVLVGGFGILDLRPNRADRDVDGGPLVLVIGLRAQAAKLVGGGLETLGLNRPVVGDIARYESVQQHRVGREGGDGVDRLLGARLPGQRFRALLVEKRRGRIGAR